MHCLAMSSATAEMVEETVLEYATLETSLRAIISARWCDFRELLAAQPAFDWKERWSDVYYRLMAAEHGWMEARFRGTPRPFEMLATVAAIERSSHYVNEQIPSPEKIISHYLRWPSHLSIRISPYDAELIEFVIRDNDIFNMRLRRRSGEWEWRSLRVVRRARDGTLLYPLADETELTIAPSALAWMSIQSKGSYLHFSTKRRPSPGDILQLLSLANDGAPRVG